MGYQHTQTAPLHLLLWAVALAMLAGAWQTPDAIAQVLLAFTALLMAMLALTFRQLTVSDQGDHLLICFGPLPLFWRRIGYSQIESVQRTRSTLLDGWGIHLSPSGGWTWNLWGFDCVDLRLARKRKLRLGTDDAENLESFLKQRIGS